MAPLTLEQKLTQLQFLSAPETLAAWAARHPAEREAVRAALEALADRELARRTERLVAARIAAAKFIRVQTVDSFNFEYNGATRKLRSRYLNLLATDLVAEGVGALFVGGSGLGKTHLARALGYAQCQRGHRVLFTTLAALVNRLSTAEATKSLHRALKAYQSPLVLCVDEIGYATLRQSESHLLFQVLSVRHDRKRPTLITIMWNHESSCFCMPGASVEDGVGGSGIGGSARGSAPCASSRGVGPAGVGVSASRLSNRSTASAPSSTAARSSSVSGIVVSIRWRCSLASSSCTWLEAFGR
jgi:DNA replication protein DnaC